MSFYGTYLLKYCIYCTPKYWDFYEIVSLFSLMSTCAYETLFTHRPAAVLLKSRTDSARTEYNLRSWLTKGSGRAAVEEEGPRKQSGTN
jgi:hypothetical protein